MATTYSTNTAAYLKSGANCSITDCTCYDASSTYLSGTMPIFGDLFSTVICTRFKIHPTAKVKSVTLTINHKNKNHGYGERVTFYAKASTSGTAWPANNRTTGPVTIGQLSDGSGVFSVTVPITATSSDFYVYIWGYLNIDSIGQHEQYVTSVGSVSAVRGGASFRVKKDGTNWAISSAVHVKTADGWKEATAVYVKTADGWKEAT